MLPAVWAATLLLCGCAETSTVRLSGEEAYVPRHAEGYSIYATDGASTVIEIRNPWQGGDSVRTQLFVSRGNELPPEGFDGVTVAAPVQRAVCFSSTHVAFLDALDATDAIRGVSGAEYISNKKVRERYREGDIRDVGYDTNVNYELLASLRPDIVFIYGVGGENTAVTDKFRELHIPFVYIGEYMETTPLGKAEWLVPFGELTDRREEAAALFTDIETRYDSLRMRATAFAERPSVMLNAPLPRRMVRAGRPELHGTAHRGCGRPLHFRRGGKLRQPPRQRRDGLSGRTAGRCLAESQPGREHRRTQDTES